MLWLCRVLKEVHPDVGISKQGMQVMNTFATDMFDKIVKEAAKLTQISKKATLSSREIQTAGEQSCLPLQYKVYKSTTISLTSHKSHKLVLVVCSLHQRVVWASYHCLDMWAEMKFVGISTLLL